MSAASIQPIASDPVKLARGSLAKAARRLRRALQRLREKASPRAVHQSRIAVRRVRTAIRFHTHVLSEPPRRWERSLRRLARTLGKVRDVDTQIDAVRGVQRGKPDKSCRPGLTRLLLRLRQRRERAAERIERALDRFEAKGVLDEMLATARLRKAKPAVPAFQIITAHVREQIAALLALDEVSRNSDDVEGLHNLRLAAKELRYTLEMLAPADDPVAARAIAAAKAIQSTLGDLHDCDVWLAQLPEFLDDERRRTVRYLGTDRAMARLRPGIEFLLSDRRRRRERAYEEFRAAWQGAIATGTWDLFGLT